MSLNEILASTPIKVNPWSAVGKIIRNGMRAIGKSMNKDVMDKLESVQKELKLQEQMMASTRIASLKITMHSVRLSDFR